MKEQTRTNQSVTDGDSNARQAPPIVQISVLELEALMNDDAEQLEEHNAGDLADENRRIELLLHFHDPNVVTP